jgi:hypothetical protein
LVSTTLDDAGNDVNKKRNFNLGQERLERRVIQNCLHDVIDQVVSYEEISPLIDEILNVIEVVDDTVTQVIILERDSSCAPSSPPPINEMESPDDESLNPLQDETVESITLSTINTSPDDDAEENTDDVLSLHSSTSASSDEWMRSIERTDEGTQDVPKRDSWAELHQLRDYLSTIEQEQSIGIEDAPPSTDNRTIPAEASTSVDQSFVLSSPSSSSSSLVNVEVEVSTSESSSLDAFATDQPSITNVQSPVRLSVVHRHALPIGIQVVQLTCSSLFVLLCTADQRIFFARFNEQNTDLPLQWQQHSELAEQLAISLSSRTVWRWFNRHLYCNHDALRFAPLGNQWSSIPVEHNRCIVSMSVNDRCGWSV